MNIAPETIISIFKGIKGELAFVVDILSMNIVAANGEACGLLGYSDEEIKGIDLTDIILCLRPSRDGIDSELFSGKNYFSGFLTSDGKEIPISFTMNKIGEGEGDLGVVIGRQVSVSEAIPGDIDLSSVQYKKALDSIEEGIVVIDRELKIRLYNASFKYMVEKFGYRGDLIGTPLNEAADYLTGKLSLEYKYVIQSGKTLETSIKKSHGERMLWYQVAKSPLVIDGEVAQVVSIIRETTHQQELEQMKKESIFRIEKNMEQFAILNDHIRNPLQTIVGLADLEGGESSEKIITAAMEIDEIVKELDSGWIESDKIREMLFRHYGLKVTRRPNVSSPIGMLRVVDKADDENS